MLEGVGIGAGGQSAGGEVGISPGSVAGASRQGRDERGIHKDQCCLPASGEVWDGRQFTSGMQRVARNGVGQCCIREFLRGESNQHDRFMKGV